MSDGHLRKEDTELYKGIGILLVVLHNYFHWVEPSPGENELTFERDRTIELLLRPAAAAPRAKKLDLPE